MVVLQLFSSVCGLKSTSPSSLILEVQCLLNIVFSTRLRKSFADNPSWLGRHQTTPPLFDQVYQDFIQPFSISQVSQSMQKYVKSREVCGVFHVSNLHNKQHQESEVTLAQALLVELDISARDKIPCAPQLLQV